MTEFVSDIIIQFYCKMLSKTQACNNLPEYSEIYLRLAFKYIFGLNYVISPDVLQLYRKILVLHYCQEYVGISDVCLIMEKCFSKSDIYAIIADRENYVKEWAQFKNTIQNCISSEDKILKKRSISLTDITEFNKKLKT